MSYERRVCPRCDDPQIRVVGDGPDAWWHDTDDDTPDHCFCDAAEAAEKIKRLREAAIDVIQRIEEWEAAIRTIVGGDIEHGMDLTKLRAAVAPASRQQGK